jgi:hypothetical protein
MAASHAHGAQVVVTKVKAAAQAAYKCVVKNKSCLRNWILSFLPIDALKNG